MARHQYGIFAEGTRATTTSSWRSGRMPPTRRRGRARRVRAAVADNRTNGGVDLVIGFGAVAVGTPRLHPGRWSPRLPRLPAARRPHVAPATQRDVWIWVHGPMHRRAARRRRGRW